MVDNTDDTLKNDGLNSFRKFQTDRLIIRNFMPEDAMSCYEGWGTDKSLGKFITGYPMEKSQMQSFVMTLAGNKDAWVLVEKESGDCIGYMTMDIPYMPLGIGEIGYVIGERYQHRGYAYEALQWILREYLVNRDLYMVEAKYNEDNLSSSRLLEKLGFRLDGRLRDRRIDFETGKRKDLVVCSITKKEKLK